MTKFGFSATILIIFSVLGSQVNASPSYEATIDYIMHNVRDDLSRVSSWIEFPDRCVMRYHHKTIFRGGSEGRIERYTLKVVDLDPKRARVDDLVSGERNNRRVTRRIELNTFRNSDRIVHEVYQGRLALSYHRGAKPNQMRFNRYNNRSYVHVRRGGSGERQAKAFKHLIKMCGGSTEPEF